MGTHTLKKLLDDRFPGIFQEITESYLPKTILTDANAAAASVKPTVVIGLGGSGVKAVARLKWRIYDFYRGGDLKTRKRVLASRLWIPFRMEISKRKIQRQHALSTE